MEKTFASASTVRTSYSSDGQTIQIKEGPPLFDDEGKDFTKPCKKSSTEGEAKGLEGKEEANEVTLNLKCAPKLDTREISLDEVSSEEFEPKREPPGGATVLLYADNTAKPHLDSGYFSVDGVESNEAGSEVDSPSQRSRDAPVSEQSSQSLRHGEIEDVVPSNTSTLNERTEYFHLAEAGDQERQQIGKRENSIDNVQKVKCRIIKDNEEIVEIECCQNQKSNNKKPRKLIANQKFFKILRKALRECILPKQVYKFFAKKCLIKFGLSNLRSREANVCAMFPVLQRGLDRTTLDMKDEWYRFSSFVSLTSCTFQKLSPLKLATDGFYYISEHRKIQCFACDKWHTPEYLENLLQDCGTSDQPKDIVHENWCLISDSGNIPIHPSPGCNDIGNPSCYKRPFKDAEGRLIRCKHMCGLNTIFMDVSHMLTEFPALKDAFKNCRAGKLILEMLEFGKLNSARGIYHILLQLHWVKPKDTEINLQSFELIRFLCILNKEEIVIERMCSKGCPMQCTFTKEQIIINPPKTRDGSMNIIQQGILEFFEDLCPSSKCCNYCLENVHLTFTPLPPPFLFLNVWRLIGLEGFEVPAVVNVLDHRYRVGTVYVHEDQHFTGWIYKPGRDQEWTYYDDSKVNRRDKFSADLDGTKEFPGNECMVVVSYYLQ